MIRRLIILAALALAAADPVGARVAHPPAGAVAGKVERGIAIFRGIPYALPPVGPMRWKPPAPHPAWDGVRPALEFGPACIQPRPRANSIYANPPTRISEDCLTLNIWAPEKARDAPVFVWIHGGALTTGYSHEPIYDGSRLADRGLIVVSINYRLGPLGYLAHPELSAESPEGVSGNYGLLDQIAALRWVRDNIAAFGGDPSNVTIAGESAGALSVMYLMASPQARGLFHKAIAQSAYMISTPSLREARHGELPAEEAGMRMARAIGAADLPALRAMDALALTEAALKSGYAPWGTIDGKILPRQLVETFDAGEQAPVPLLAGFNSGEIRSLTFLLPPLPTDAAAYEARIRERYGNLAEAWLQRYPARDLRETLLATTRDAMYGWTAERLAIRQSAIRQPSYLYLFDHGYPAAAELGLHGFHAAEIPYIFGTTHATPPYWPRIPDTLPERRLARAMGDYWASFAKTGTPVAEGFPDWKPYGADAAYMAFEGVPRSGKRLMPGMFVLHEATVCRRRAAGNVPWNWNTGILSPVLVQSPGCP